jgi:hypothetical protein
MTILQSSHIVVKKLYSNYWSVCTEQEDNGDIIMTPFCILAEGAIKNLPHFVLEQNNDLGLERSTVDEVLEKFVAYKSKINNEN